MKNKVNVLFGLVEKFYIESQSPLFIRCVMNSHTIKLADNNFTHILQ